MKNEKSNQSPSSLAYDKLVKSQILHHPVIPAQAGMTKQGFFTSSSIYKIKRLTEE